MERSEEVRAALNSLINTFGTPAMGSAFLSAMSSEPESLVIGTDPDEWWDEPESIKRAISAQGDELQGMTARVFRTDGWVEGNVGWAAARAEVEMPGGSPVNMRITAVYLRRHDGWKIAQAHASVGVANEDVVGKELTI